MKNKYDLKVDVYTYLRDIGFNKNVIDMPDDNEDYFDEDIPNEERYIEIGFDLKNEKDGFKGHYDLYEYEGTDEEFGKAWNEAWDECFPKGVAKFKKWLKDEGFKHEFVYDDLVRVYPYVRKDLRTN